MEKAIFGEIIRPELEELKPFSTRTDIVVCAGLAELLQ